MVTKSVTLDEKRKGLSERESFFLSYLSERGKRIFELREVEKCLNCSYEEAKVIVFRLNKKKWIERIGKGKYLIVPLSAGVKGEYKEHEFIIASIFKPCYIGYWTALNYHGFTEQVPNVIFVATGKRVKGREIFETKYKFIYLSERKFFGFTEVSISNYKINISDKEKTIIDCLDKPRYCGGVEEIVKSLSYARYELNFKKLESYSLRMGNNSILKRLGFILDFLGFESLNLENKISSSYSVLDPTKERKGEYNSKWRILVNVSDRVLRC